MGAKQKRLFYHFYPSFPSRQKDFPVFTPLRRYRRSGYYQNIFQAIRSHCPPVRKAWETLFVCVDFRSANEAAKKIRRYRGSAFSPCHQSAHRNKMVASGLVGILPWGTLQKFGTYRIFARRDQFGARLSGQVPGQRCSPPDLFPPVFVFAGSFPAGTHTPDDLKAITEKIITTPSGYEVCLYFFNTQEILEQYGAYMIDEKDYQGTRSGAKFSKSEIESRRFTREIKQNQRRHAEQNGLLPLGLSYST